MIVYTVDASGAILSGSRVELVPAVRDGLREQFSAEVPLIVGGG